MFDRYRGGLTIGGVLPQVGEDGDLGAVHGSVEEAVVDLIAGGESDAIERVA